MGWLLIAVGVATVALIFLQPQQLRVPAWVAYAAASIFSFAGLALVAGALGAEWLVSWLGILVVIALLVPSLWVTLGPGEQNCSVSLGGVRGEGSDWICRAGFGVGSLLGLVVLFLLIRQIVSSNIRR